MNEFCVLVTSSDRGKDIFDLCFAHSERIWRNCDWPRYVGFNSPYPDQYGFATVTAAPTGNWSDEVGQYVDMLPDEIKYILLMVEDTLFIKPVDARKLNDIAWTASDWRLSYLRLVPKRRNIFYWPRFSGVFERIYPNDPYYSSTEMVLWERGYLREQLERGADAWSFEHRITKQPHWAVWQPVFDQHQIVQKGYWNWDAPRLLERAGLPPPPPGRPYQSLRARWRGHWQNFNFALFGWTTFKVRRWLSSRSLPRHTTELIP